MMKKSILEEVDEAIIDPEYLKRKIEYANRISTNRAQRIRLRQELSAYKKLEKTGEKPIEDPKIQTEVANLQANFKSETLLNEKLSLKINTLNQQLSEIEVQIKNVSELIQKQKIEQQPQLTLETNRLHLVERKETLQQAIKNKETKIIELEHDLLRLRKETDLKNKQSAILSHVSSWQQGEVPKEESEDFLQRAYSFYKNAVKFWQEARFAYDRKNFIPEYYYNCWKALDNSINLYYVLLTSSVENNTDDIHDKINILYNNKIFINTKLLDSLISLVDRISKGVDVSPTAQYPDDLLEFMIKNMTNLKIL